MESISHSKTLCIIYSLLMHPASYGMMAELVGRFLFDLTYYELPPLPPELAADMISLSGLAGNMGALDVPYVVCVWFEFILLIPMADGVAVSGVAVSVSACSAWLDPALLSKAGHPPSYVRMFGENSRTSG